MNSAFILYTILLLIEGALAWLISGEGFLIVTLTTSLGIYYGLGSASRNITEGTRLVAAAVLAVATPFYYQNDLVPLLLCFIALPHFLAATQALQELRRSREGVSPAHSKMTGMVFSIAFYSSMGLVFLLGRGMEPEISRLTTGLLSLAVLLLSLPAWDLSRVARLKAGQIDKTPLRQKLRNGLVTAGLLALAAIIFAGPLPVAANLLSRLSPHWRMNPIEFRNKPPKTPGEQNLEKVPELAKVPAPLESAGSGQHQLPQRSDLKGTDDVDGYVKLKDPAQAAALLQAGPLYIRSHTLNRFDGRKWEADVSGGVWIEDNTDGVEDGIVTLRTGASPVEYEMFLVNTTGYSLPAIQNLTAIQLPRVFAGSGDVLQISGAGNLRFQAASSPSQFESLPNSIPIRSGKPESPIHFERTKGELGIRLAELSTSLFRKAPDLPAQVATLRKFMADTYEYSGVMKNPHDLDPLQNFLFDERQGYCDFFATAAALLLRDAGVPTRIAYGYATDEIDATNGILTFRNRNAHSWTEIYIDQIGWTICDFTPPQNIGKIPGDEPAPPRNPPNLDPSQFAEASKQEPPQPKLTDRNQVPPNFFANLFDSLMHHPWAAAVKSFGPGVLLGIAVLFLAVRLLRRTPEEIAAAAAAKALAAREKQPPYFMEYLRVSAGAGHPKPDGNTPLEHFATLEKAGLPVPPLRPLIRYHCAQRYEDAPPDEDREKSFFNDLKAFADATTPTTPLLTSEPAPRSKTRK